MPCRRPALYDLPAWVLFLTCFGGGDALAATPLKTVLVASGFDQPLLVTAPPGDRERIFVAEQFTARIKIVRAGTVLDAPFLDIGPLVKDFDFDSGESGLLGLAFHPAYATNGAFFVYYVDNDGNSVIARYRVSADPDRADPASGEILLTVPHPYEDHYAGTLAFGPNDGYLYASLGDGGSFGDPGNRAQSPEELLGKILRLDVDGAAPYAIPADNPFAGGGGRPEIWALGLRNPWRFSFDRRTGDLFIGDVGQDRWEEIDFQAAATPGGVNFGWRRMEASACYDPPVECDPGDLTLPIQEYPHDPDCAVTGGYVYRGCGLPGLDGTYFYADFCSGRIASFRYVGGAVTEMTDRTAELAPRGLDLRGIASFGEDGFGELYLVDLFDGEVFKIVSAIRVGEDCNGNGVPDGCDIAEGTSRDCNADVIPDECVSPFSMDGGAPRAGSPFTATARCGTPGKPVVFACSLTGPGFTPTPIGALGLDRAKFVGWARAGADGSASVTVTAPLAGAGRTVWWQAIEVPSGTVTDVESATVGGAPQ